MDPSFLYKSIIKPLVFALTAKDPETAHYASVKLLMELEKSDWWYKLVNRALTVDDKRLGQTVAGLYFPRPVGLAAGYLKELTALSGAEALGFGSIEAGTITGLPQFGNPRPRIWRFSKKKALVNCMGFPSKGARSNCMLPMSENKPSVPLGINIGCSAKIDKTDMDGVISDYLWSMQWLQTWAQYWTINVSSPNTVGLRDLQEANKLKSLLKAVIAKSRPMVPVFVKLAPDLTVTALDQALRVIHDVGASGVIACNTTINRQNLPQARYLPGGLSGPMLFPRALEMVKHIREQMPDIPIIGVGGIDSAVKVWQMMEAGANLVQIFTAMIYEGPFIVRKIHTDLLSMMARYGVKSISDIYQA